MSLYGFIESFINENPDIIKITKEENYNFNQLSDYFSSKVRINKNYS